MTTAALAEELKVDPKTAERWVATGRPPYARTRQAIAAKLGESERYLWPDAVGKERREQVSESELLHVYPHRSSVPFDLWDRLLDQATEHVDMLVYVGMFMTEKPNLLGTLREKAASGARVRLAFGDRDCSAVMQRSLDEGIGEHTISAKIDQALAFFRPLSDVPGIEIRTHGTVLYNSLYRFDEEMIVNPHVYGKLASHAPALHLRRLDSGDLFNTYADSFDAVWSAAASHTW
ncbi:XRE family transcriptional regulator [Saccharopolyspora sp. NFXS83]|uniref:XRE family transcriptional regulator n=1 Tax=Saccharopolyspora sp. NFXS83 TaxID=2993560 RepID=UPI00224A6F0D|nr:XRE family transcriptional regulator [Saccharopolyspora sp. NFXS83]MCX2734457.1 XRE family transcriptional regulator [Saccharopolyspora sp. NFXS83]